VAQYRCQLERLGAPHWACALAGILFALIVIAYVALISVDLWNRAFTPRWVLPLIWILGCLAVALSVRSSVRVFRHAYTGESR
jgi:hypothetical protein